MSLYWRMVLTSVLAILVATLMGYYLTNMLDRWDSGKHFENDTKQLYSQLLQETQNTELEVLLFELNNDPEFPFTVFLSDKQSTVTDIKKSIGDNQYEIWYQLPNAKQFVGFQDKIVFDSDEVRYATHLSDIEKVVTLLATTIVIAIAFIGLSYSIKKQISRLELISKEIAKGNFEAKTGDGFHPPFDAFANSIGIMQSRIKALVDQYQTLSFAIPHELRTPLAKLRFTLDLTPETIEPQEYKALIQKLDRYTDELEVLTKQLLELTNSKSVGQKEKVKLSELLAEITPIDKAISIKHSYPEDQTIKVHRTLFSRALFNLIDNAAKYGADTLKISCQISNNSIQILLQDNGPGIALEFASNIFDAFNRGDKKGQDGSGLGLAITKLIVKRHGGTIELVESSLGGAAFKIDLPS